jgi:hypothetical protein
MLLVGSISVLAWQTAAAMECGDLDDSGAITTHDALVLLRRAVGLEVAPLQCPDNCTITTTTTTNTSGDECFDDEECVALHGPGFVCGGPNGFTCVACNNDDDCGPDHECIDYLCYPKAP